MSVGEVKETLMGIRDLGVKRKGDKGRFITFL